MRGTAPIPFLFDDESCLVYFTKFDRVEDRIRSRVSSPGSLPAGGGGCCPVVPVSCRAVPWDKRS
jgi:hypothetical protein